MTSMLANRRFSGLGPPSSLERGRDVLVGGTKSVGTQDRGHCGLLVVDVQPCFNPPASQVEQIARLASVMYSVATVERHDESLTPFWRQFGWKPTDDDEPLVATDKLFVKHGYAPPADLIEHLKDEQVERVPVCGIQADTCCLAAGFLLFDAGLNPTMLKWLTVGSSLDRSADLDADQLRRLQMNAVPDGRSDAT